MSLPARNIAIEHAAPEPERGPIEHAKTMPSFDYRSMMLDVMRKYSKNYFAQLREMYELKLGPGRIAPVEYYYYGLYAEALTPEQKRAFVGTTLRAAINDVVLNKELFGLGKDKLAFYAWMHGLGLAAPRTRAVFHPERSLSGAAGLTSAHALLEFLRTPSNYPFFSKPANLTASVGTASVERYESADDSIVLADGRRFPATRFVGEVERYFKAGYLIQERLDPHPELAVLASPRLSTVRMMVLNEGGAQLIRASWRAPAGESHADVLWRGNLLAQVDIETGRILRVVQGRGLDCRVVEDHPETGARLLGARLPMWAEARALALRAAAAAPKLALTGWDVAITDQGPVVIELEPDGGDPAVTQLASGQGLLDGPYGVFVERHRDKLKRKKI
jgi:hypothetical protein